MNWLNTLADKDIQTIRMRRFWPLLLALSWSFANVALAADEAEVAQRNIAKAMTLLRENCLSCHNGEKQKGDLALHTREKALKGGENGVVLLPGDSVKSLLVKSLAPEADPHMPPKKQLAEPQIATLRAWVDAGAAWDESVLNAPRSAPVPADFGPLPALYHPVLALALSGNGKLLALGRGNQVFIHDTEKPEDPLIQTLSGPRDAVQSLAISPDGELVVAGEFQKVWLWETKTWTTKATLTNQLAGRVTSANFTPDGKWLVLAYGETAKAGLMQVVEVASGSVKYQWTAHSDTIYACSISRDGKLLATGSADKLVRLWALPEGKEKGQFEGHTGHVLAVAFNEDSTRLASGGSDKELKVWDVQTKQKVIAIAAHSSPITGLAWTPDGKTLVSTCEDGAARTFSEFKVQTGEERSGGARDRKVNSIEAPLISVATSADAKVIYAGSIQGSTYVWESGGKQKAELKPAAPPTTASVPVKE